MKAIQFITKLIWPAGVSCVVVGALFKILHWEGGNLLLLIGILSIAAGFLLKLVLKDEKFRMDDTSGVLNIVGFIVMFGGMVIRFYRIPHANKVLILGMAMMAAAYFFRKPREEQALGIEEQIEEIGKDEA